MTPQIAAATVDIAEKLDGFLRLIYNAGERVRFFALMPENLEAQYLHPESTARAFERLPKALYRACTSLDATGRTRVRTKFGNAIASCTVGSRTFAASVNALQSLNRLGYEIFFTPNPLRHNRRLQKTVAEIRYLVIESDGLPLADQEVFAEYIKPSLRTVVFTGNRSLHMYVPIQPAITNPYCFQSHQWREVRDYNPKADRTPHIVEHQEVVAVWRAFLLARAFPYDPTVLADYSKLVRVPYFKHWKTNAIAEVRFSNPEMTSGFSRGLDFLGQEGINTSPKGLLAWDQIVRKVSRAHYVQIPATTYSGNNVEMNELSKTMDETIASLPVETLSTPIQPSAKALPPCESDSARSAPSTPCGDCEQFKGGLEQADMTILGTSATRMERHYVFLDDLMTYERLLKAGLPSRGTRRSLHRVMFTAAEILSLTEFELADQWHRIISLAPQHSGLGPDDAARDLLDDLHKRRANWVDCHSRTFHVFLPDTNFLPDYTPSLAKRLRSTLKGMGCAHVRATASLLGKVFWPSIKKAPHFCLRGSLPVKSLDMRGADRHYVRDLKWLAEAHLVTCTDPRYLVGKRSRLYKVNIPLLLYRMDFKEDELTWASPVSREGAKFEEQVLTASATVASENAHAAPGASNHPLTVTGSEIADASNSHNNADYELPNALSLPAMGCAIV